uniref:C6 domain-containing protein n=1 Tax=Panagrolaimus sp. JU765 TaxID=591449 RepID=A0AC34Q526_9BILA
MTAVCDASSVNGAVSMEFNNGAFGGPTDGTTSIASATLNCVNGVWLYTNNGVTNQIFEISCLAGGNTAACTGCSLNSITLVQGANVGEKPTSNGIQVVNGCQQLTVVCDASSVNNAFVYMAFNNFIGGPTNNFLPRVTATFQCVNGAWTYTEGTTTTTVTQVDCLQNSNRRRLMKIVQTG